MSRPYQRLGPEAVEVLWSRWRQGKTPAQISAELGCHEWTIGWHVDRSGGFPRAHGSARRGISP